MEEQQTGHGGKRSRSGRKPVEDKRVSLCIYPQQSRVNALGKEEAKQIALDAIEKEYKKRDKK